jgi:MSHA biogenesis protein MshN
MSVINQVLLDLEKRRASGAERSVLPNHVRALPAGERTLHWGWIAAGATIVAVMLVVSWVLYSGFDWTHPRAAVSSPPQRSAEVVIERVVAASAGVTLDARPVDESDGAGKETLASRLSFELSSLPVQDEAGPGARPLLPTARVVGKPAAAEAAARSEAPAVPAERPARSSGVTAPARAPVAATAAKPEIQKEVRQLSPRDLAENEYRKAITLMHQKRLAESQEGFQAALNLYPGHLGARQALVGLMLESRKPDEAERVLQEGLAIAPAQPGFAMTLARLQVERGDPALAVATLKKGLEHAQGSADYVAFLGALLQRQGRHEEAIEQFQAALRARPAAGVWWLGIGISLQAVNRAADAQDAYRRARASNNLSPELAAFADQRLRQLQ